MTVYKMAEMGFGRQLAKLLQWLRKKRAVPSHAQTPARGALSHLSEQSTCSKFSRKKLREKR